MPVVETPLCGPSCLSKVAHTEGLSRYLNGGNEVSAGMTWGTLIEIRDANAISELSSTYWTQRAGLAEV